MLSRTARWDWLTIEIWLRLRATHGPLRSASPVVTELTVIGDGLSRADRDARLALCVRRSLMSRRVGACGWLTAVRYLVVGSAAILLVLLSGGYLAQLSEYMGQSVFRVPAATASIADHPPAPLAEEPDMQGMLMGSAPGER
jgi:hypothetical protein